MGFEFSDAEVWGLADIADEMLAPAAGPNPDVDGELDVEHEIGPAPAMDSAGIVRVWLDEGRLTGVRVSHGWRTRLGRRTLEGCFAEALAIATLRAELLPLDEDGSMAEFVPADEPETFDDIDFGKLPRFNSESFQGIHARFEEVEQRWTNALEDQRSRQSDPPSPTTGTYRGVTVTLDGDGHAERVSFDKTWLAEAQAEGISSHVLRAAQAAYARFVPAEEGRAELEECEAEHQFLMAAFKAMLNREER